MATNPNIPSSKSTNSKPSLHLPSTDEMREVFNLFDTNGDGKISVTEVGDCLKAIGTAVPPEYLGLVMDDLDSDHDGFISRDEFAAFYSQICNEGGASELRGAFDLFDADANGLISAAELHRVLERLGMKFSVEDCKRMIKFVDSDGDGNVDFEDFKKMMTDKIENGVSKTSAGNVYLCELALAVI